MRPAGQQRRRRLEQRAAADLGPELPVGQHQQDDRGHVEGEAEVLAEVLGGRVVARRRYRRHSITARPTMLRSSTNQAMRLRAVSAAASKASTNDHAKLVSGKLNR